MKRFGVETMELLMEITETLEVEEHASLYLDRINALILETIGLEEHVECFKEVEVKVQVLSEIELKLEFKLTDKEMIFLESLSIDSIQSRREQVGRLYFAMRMTLREIAEKLGVSHSLIHNDVLHVKNEVLKNIKKDLRTHKKLLGHMVECIYSLMEIERQNWNKYNQLENDIIAMRRTILILTNLQNLQPSEALERANRIESMEKTVLAIHDRQQGYMALITRTIKEKVDVWDKFGLCGEEALKVIFSGGFDIDVKVEKVRTFMYDLMSIVKAEVTDARQKQRIFIRVAKELKPDVVLARNRTDTDKLLPGGIISS